MENLRLILGKHGFSFKKQFGQNFISDTNLLRSIVELAGIDKSSTVLEIGCGAGTLTRELAASAKEVFAFEIDEKLKPVLAETLADCPNATVTFKDFLKVDLAALERELAPYTVVANLPYYITSPLVMRFVEESEKVRALVIMVQDDVAKRFCAEAGTSEYGAITAAIARRASAEIVKYVPRPHVLPRAQRGQRRRKADLPARPHPRQKRQVLPRHGARRIPFPPQDAGKQPRERLFADARAGAGGAECGKRAEKARGEPFRPSSSQPFPTYCSTCGKKDK